MSLGSWIVLIGFIPLICLLIYVAWRPEVVGAPSLSHPEEDEE